MTEKKVNKKDAGEPSNTQKTSIPLEKIIPNREQHTGIRNKEKFEHLKASIQEHGLLNPITVRPVGDKYELIAGYHRVEAFNQLGKKEITAKIVEVDDDTSAEMCLTDNLCRADLTSLDKETYIMKRWENGKYSSMAELARKIGVSDAWVGICIKAHKIRKDLQKHSPSLNLDVFSSQTLLDASAIMNDRQEMIGIRELSALLDIATKKKYKPSKIKMIARTIPTWTQQERESVLYEGVSYDKVNFEKKSGAGKSIPRGKRKKALSVEELNSNFIVDTYSAVAKYYGSIVADMEDHGEKETSLRYAKVTTALLARVLANEHKISEEQYKAIKEMLGIKWDDAALSGYKGEVDLQGLNKYFGDDKSKATLDHEEDDC